MKINKKIVFLIVVVLLLGTFAIYQVAQQTKNGSLVKNREIAEQEKNSDKNNPGNSGDEALKDASIIYFYGSGCSHCKNVSAFLEKNDIESKVDFVKKEIQYNRKNGEEFRNAALKCGLNPSDIGVPFVFSEGKCYMGEPEVMQFFSDKAGV